MKRKVLESLALRLAKRECFGAPPGAVVPHSRRLYESIVPDTAVPGVAPPPNTVLLCFTPCGHSLVAFQPITNEVVLYKFKGLHRVTSAPPPARHAAAADPAGAAPAAAAASAGVQPAARDAGAAGGAATPPQHERNGQASAQPQQPQQPREQQQQQPQAGAGGPAAAPHARVAFGDVFEEQWRCCPCPAHEEQLAADFCLVAHGRHLLVATASAERQPPAGAHGAALLLPRVDSTTFHLLDLASGALLDRHSVRRDYVELARNQGAHLRGQLLLVLGLASQTLHLLHLLPAGRFLFLRSVGEHCREDDAWVIAQQQERERRLRLQQERQRAQQREVPSLPTSGSFPSLQALASGRSGATQAPTPPTPQPPLHAGPAGAARAAPGSSALGAAATAAAPAQPPTTQPAAAQLGGELDSASEGGDGGEEDGEEDEAAAYPLLISGLKQSLLACLFREAQQAAAAAAAAAATQAAPPGSHSAAGLPRASGSTGSLAKAAGGGALPPPRPTSSSGSLAGLLGGRPAAAAPGFGDGGAVLNWRRPLDRFFYYFESHLELLMWKAQLLDEQRLLILWCPPEMLAGPHRNHHGPPTAGGHHGSYLMLYNLGTAEVERLLPAHSPQLAAWFAAQPGAFHGGHDCPCGCATEWERWAAAPGGSRAAREQQLRDPQLAARELRRRLPDELPASSQMRQLTPYLDPDLYCFDERAVGGTIRPHHPPHRSIKFMCRRQPERLRFRLDPEHLQPPQTRAQEAGGRPAAARSHVVYLFHPVQPFLLAVMQDAETAAAEQLTLFTRL